MAWNHLLGAARLEKAKKAEDERWQQACRQMFIEIVDDRRDAARRILDEFMVEYSGNQTLYMEDHVSKLICWGVIPEAVGAVEAAGYVTVRSLFHATRRELLDTRNINRPRVDDLAEGIKAAGLGDPCFAEETPPWISGSDQPPGASLRLSSGET